VSHLFIIYHCFFLFLFHPLFLDFYTRMTWSCILWHKAQDLTWVIWMKVGASWAPVACARSASEDCATDQDFYLNFSIVSVKMSARLGQGCGALGSGQGRRDIVTTRAKVSLSSHVGCCQQCALCTLPWQDLDFLGQLCCWGRLAQWTVGALAGNLCSHSTPGLSPECPD